MVVLFPASRENAASFAQVYAREFGEAAPPGYRIVFDENARITEKLGGQFTRPLTVFIDMEGRVRHRFEGANDRQQAKDLSSLIQRLKS